MMRWVREASGVTDSLINYVNVDTKRVAHPSERPTLKHTKKTEFEDRISQQQHYRVSLKLRLRVDSTRK